MNNVDDITLSHLKDVHERLLEKNGLFFQTPLIDCTQQLRQLVPDVKSVFLKLESMQCTGSFKVRGVLSQFLSLGEDDIRSGRTLVTMSAGNYGKAFAYIAKKNRIPGVVFMPESAPVDRKVLIESYGCKVFRCPTIELMENVRKHEAKHGSLFLHSFDDPNIMTGHASAGLELISQVPDIPDVVLVCCGGGGYLAGVAAALKLSGWTSTDIYGIEPEKAPTMFDALQHGQVIPTKVKTTIASGLAPPFAGENCFKLVKKYVKGVLLVTDEEIKSAMKTLYGIGLVVEPSGAAAMAALLSGKVGDITDKRVVVFVTGGNVSSEELEKHLKSV